MKITLAVVLASMYGLSLRIMFDIFGPFTEIMSMSFLFLAPIIIGYLTIILIPRRKRVSAGGAFFLPWLTTLALLIVTMALSIEGSICWIMIYPFFAILSGIGGVIANRVRRKREEVDDFPDILNVSLLVLLPIPIITGLFEKDTLSSTQEYTFFKQVEIAAPAAKVWSNLANINSISKQEYTATLITAVGFPRHIKTTLDTLSVGGHRTALFDKGLYFNETITKCVPEKELALDIKTDPTKIPPTTMDEHILIGGKHIDVMEDKYTLEALPDGKCRLSLSSRYKICTPFNWYAKLWADLLLGDMLGGELDIIKQRSAVVK